jgi:hypothetical protein
MYVRGSGPSYREELEALRDRFTDRRTVPRQLLDDALGLVDTTVAELQTRHEAQLAEVERQHDRVLGRLEVRASRAEDRVRELEAMRTNLRETRETVDDGVLVKIAAPRTSSHGEGYPRPWTIAELDAVLYRLRLGGGTDDTEVRIGHRETEATIPFPELVLDPPAKREPEVVAHRPRRWRPVVLIAATGATLGAAMVLIVALLGGAA